MLVSVEFADAGSKSGTHRVLIIGRGPESPATGDIGLSLEAKKTGPESTWSGGSTSIRSTPIDFSTAWEYQICVFPGSISWNKDGKVRGIEIS